MIGKYELHKCRDLVIMGGSGVSTFGRSVRVLHASMEPRPASFSQWYGANTTNCAGWALDWEDWAKQPDSRQWFLDAVKQKGDVTWLAPQLWLGGGNPFVPIFKQPHAATVRDMDGAFACVTWQYGSAWSRWQEELGKIRSEGYRGVLVAMMDGGRRAGQSGGYNTVQECVDIVNWAADQGIGIGLFMPQLDPDKIAPVLRAVVARYGVTPDGTPPPPPPPPPAPTGLFVKASGNQLVLNGQPFRFIADNPWTLPEMLGASSKLSLYLDVRKAQGFNTVVFWLTGSWFDRSVANPRVNMFDRSDRVFNEIEKRGMFCIPCPAVFQWDVAKQDTVRVLSASEAHALGQAFAERYRDRSSIIAWMAMAFDAWQLMSPNDVLDTAIGIREGDPNHLVMLGPRMHRTTTSYFPVSSCHEIPAYASYHKYTLADIQGPMDQIQATGRPFVNMEGPAYGDGAITVEQVATCVRLTKRWPVCGLVYIDAAIYPFRSDWQAQLDNPGVRAFLREAKS